MAKLITDTAVLYDNRSNLSAKIMMEMLVGAKNGDCYQITVKDHTVTETETESGISRSFTFLREKNVQIPIETINNLFAHVSSDIPAETPYSEREDLVRELAFLVYVQGDVIASTGKLIYGLEAQNFEIYRD